MEQFSGVSGSIPCSALELPNISSCASRHEEQRCPDKGDATLFDGDDHDQEIFQETFQDPALGQHCQHRRRGVATDGRQTKSAERVKTAKIRVFGSLTTFTGNRENPQTLPFSAELKKARAASGLGQMVEVSGIEPLASTLRTSRSPN